MKTESVGGRMSTSAYSMIYIDASRPDLFKTENNVAQQGRDLPGLVTKLNILAKKYWTLRNF